MMMLHRYRRLSFATLLFCCLILIAVISWARPFYGLMDDANIISHLGEVWAKGVVRYSFEFARDDILKWGMFRPFYPPMTTALYGSTFPNAISLFILNGLAVLAILFFFGIAAARVLMQKTHIASCASIVVLASLVFPWTHDQFLHPSLQEKLVFLAGALTWIVMSREKFHASSWFYWYPVTATLLVLGFSTKGQFAIIASTLPLIAWPFLRSRPLRLGALVCGVFAGVLILKKIGAGGGYTQGYSFANVPGNLRSPATEFLIAVGLFSLARAITAIRPFRLETLLKNTSPLVPGTLVLAYVGLFLPWKIRGYLLAFAGPLLGVVMLQEILTARPRARLALMTLVLIMAPAVTLVRNALFFSRLGDLRRILTSEQLRAIDMSQNTLHMPCGEGSGVMEYYIARFSGLKIPVEVTDENAATDQSYWIGDTKLCPLHLKNSQVLVASRLPGGFQLLQAKAAR